MVTSYIRNKVTNNIIGKKRTTKHSCHFVQINKSDDQSFSVFGVLRTQEHMAAKISKVYSARDAPPRANGTPVQSSPLQQQHNRGRTSNLPSEWQVGRWPLAVAGQPLLYNRLLKGDTTRLRRVWFSFLCHRSRTIVSSTLFPVATKFCIEIRIEF